jgi:hypothetical protein
LWARLTLCQSRWSSTLLRSPLRHSGDPDQLPLNNAAKSLITSSAVGIVSPNKDIHLDAAAYEVMAATTLMTADAQQAGENSTQGVIHSLLSAAGFLLTTLMMDEGDDHRLPVIDGDRAIPIPRVATLVALARDRVQGALARLDDVVRPQ